MGRPQGGSLLGANGSAHQLAQVYTRSIGWSRESLPTYIAYFPNQPNEGTIKGDKARATARVARQGRGDPRGRPENSKLSMRGENGTRTLTATTPAAPLM